MNVKQADPVKVCEITDVAGLRKCIVWEYARYLELKVLIVEDDAQGKGLLKKRGKSILVYPLSREGRQQELERFYARAGFRLCRHDPEWFIWDP